MSGFHPSWIWWEWNLWYYVITVLCIWAYQLWCFLLCVIPQDSSSIVKEKLYSSLSEEDSAKLIVLHCTFLAMQSSQSDQFVRAQQMFNLLHSTYFTGREVLKVWKYLLNVIIYPGISDHLHLTHFASTVTSCCHRQWSVLMTINMSTRNNTSVNS